MNPVYAKLLSDRRWKNRCQKILNRDRYRCTNCGSKKKLEVHHTYYYDNYPAPWEYPKSSLITLCNKCHRGYHLHNEIEIRTISYKRNQRQTKKKNNKIKQKQKAKFKIGTTWRKVIRKVNGEYKEVSRKI